MTREERIRDILTKSFAPETLDVQDDSHRHAGHAGARPEGETHYTVHIIASVFTGDTRVAMQRKVMDALALEFETGLHALSIKAKAAG
ncbi:MAG: BolA family protein [Pseudomonadota bacterium]